MTPSGSDAGRRRRSTPATVALTPALVGAMVVELAAAPRSPELAIASAATRGATDALGGLGTR